MGKISKDAVDNEGEPKIKEEELSYEEKLQNVSVIAKPMAPKKLAKKCYKLIKKGKYRSNTTHLFPQQSFCCSC